MAAALLCLLLTAPAAADVEDDPLLAKLEIDRLETSDDFDSLGWELDLWVGHDLNKLWFKSEGERENNETEGIELQVLYSRAVASFWDFQVGWRRDWKPRPERNWLVLGFRGLAPYFLETDAAVFIGSSGRVALRLEVERELLLTQKVILTPEIELNFHARNDERTGVGAGLSDVEASLRLHYAVTRQFMPYVGLAWERKFGNTADYAREEDEDTEDTRWVVGVSAWF